MPARKRTIRQLQRELNAKRRSLSTLRRRRARAAARLAAIDKAIAAMTGAGPGRKPGRKKKKLRRKRGRPAKKRAVRKVARKRRRATGKPLLVYMRQVLAKSSGGMRPKDVAAAVTKAGYKSYSKDFYAVVAKALLDRKNFQRVSRGIYKLAK